MPFVGTKRGKLLYNKELIPRQVGDLCAIAYTSIIRVWRRKPRWTTIHCRIKPMLPLIQQDLYQRLLNLTAVHPELGFKPELDAKYATDLAYEVFFGLYVLDYERKKRAENGDIK